MSDEMPRLERLLEGAARRVSGSGLHPLELLQRVGAAAESSVRDGVVANTFTIRLSGSDYEAYAPSLPALRQEMHRLLEGLERGRGWTRIGDRTLEFVRGETIQDGLPVVEARFSDPRHRGFVAPAGATRRLNRQHNLWLRFNDGTSTALSHTPFSIGRGPGNDVVLPVLSVSRQHAEIVRTVDGVIIRDLGSRNGIVVHGERVSEYTLDGGEHVTLGDVELWLETQ